MLTFIMVIQLRLASSTNVTSLASRPPKQILLSMGMPIHRPESR